MKLYLLVLVQDGYLIKIINFFQKRIFNFHRSRLPFDAGGGVFLENYE